MAVGMKEFDIAWKEFFKGKPHPKNDKEDRKQMEDFMDWYNNVRKQSDTGKTPSEMFNEIYGNDALKTEEEFNRMIKYEFDEDYFEPDELLIKTDQLIAKGEYGKALVNVDKVLSIVPNDEESLLIKSEILIYLDRFDESESILKKLDKRQSGDLKHFIPFYRSQRYFSQGNMFMALKYMKEAYETDNDNYDFVIGLANHLYLWNDKHYIDFVEKARKLNKKRTDKFLKKFWIEPKEMLQGEFLIIVLDCINDLMEDFKFTESEDNINFLLLHEEFLDKEFIKIIRGLHIECLFAQEKYNDASLKIEELLKFDNNNPHVYFYKAQLMYSNSKFDEALRLINACLDISEKTIPHPDFYMMKATILKKQDNDEYIYYEKKSNKLKKAGSMFLDAMNDLKEDEELYKK